MSGVPDRPVLSRRFRMQWEQAQGCYVLLYPEGMIKLNASAAEILKCCDGSTSVDEIVDAMELKFNAFGLRPEIVAMLEHAFGQGWVY